MMSRQTIARLNRLTRSRPVLRRGDGFRLAPRRTHVKEAQRRLSDLERYDGAIDGLFGTKTESAAEGFQQAHGLTADGIVGPMTWGALLTGRDAGELAGWYPCREPRGWLWGHLPWAEPHRAAIAESAERHGFDTCLIAAIGSRESGWGLFLEPQTPEGTGDSGHGHGLMQIDDRYHEDFIASGDWTNPSDNIDYGAALLRRYLGELAGLDLPQRAHLRAGLAAYNCGPSRVRQAHEEGRFPAGIDYYTTGSDYSADVLQRAGWFQREGW